MKIWHKKSQIVPKDFNAVEVRRLEGILEDHQQLSTVALQEMKEWLQKGEEGITLEEATNRLSFYLKRMGIE